MAGNCEEGNGSQLILYQLHDELNRGRKWLNGVEVMIQQGDDLMGRLYL